jgi:sensor histidine kinase regulating citrate/malate metabolism
MSFVVVVSTFLGERPRAGLTPSYPFRRQETHVTRRLSLAGQLLALQVVIICVVLVGVAAVTVAQLTKGAEETEGRRALATAETLANARATREAMADGEVEYLRIAAEAARSISGSASIVVARNDRSVVASADPAQLDTRLDIGDSTVLQGRSWTGDADLQVGRAAVAMVPVLAPRGAEPLGFVSVQRPYPGVLDGLAEAAPNLLTYLGLASAIGIVGSLLVARRVKRQTLGMEPTEIAGLVEHRDAMLHGIREGVVGLDLRGRVTLINDEAIRLLHIPGDALGRTLAELGVGEEMRDALLSGDVERDRAVASSGRVVVLNRLPIASRGRPIGSVTTLRDRTELMELRRELDLTRHVTDTLRAQAHEFSNRLHTIAGLIEIGESEEAVRFVHRVSSSRSEFSESVTASVRDPSVAALLIAKASQATELGVDLRIAPDSALPALDDELSSDVATVVGNLVDNAMDAASEAPQHWVEVALGLVDGEVEVVVRDSGAGVPPGMEKEVFRRGMSTKEGATELGPSKERGIGLSLVHLVCTRRGGDVTASSVGGSTFTATLPADVAMVGS